MEQNISTPLRFHWVPIRALAPRHRPRILDHLLELSSEDRYLRFGHPASDAQIGRYVDLIDFDHDEVFGIFNRRLQLVAMAHLAYLGNAGKSSSAEFGVSVVPGLRGRGIGARLFDRAVLHARNRHVDTLIVQALSANTPMLHIVRKAGAHIERLGSESEAVLKLPPEDASSHLEAAWQRSAAEVDYGWKRQAQRVERWLGVLAPHGRDQNSGFAHTE